MGIGPPAIYAAGWKRTVVARGMTGSEVLFLSGTRGLPARYKRAKLRTRERHRVICGARCPVLRLANDQGALHAGVSLVP